MAYKRSGTKRVIFFERNWLYASTNKKTKCHVYFYKHQLGFFLILDEVVDVIVKDKKIARWTVTTEEQLMKLNLRSEGDPKEVFINVILPTSFQAQIKKLIGVMFLLGVIKIWKEYPLKFVNTKLN